MAAPKFIQAKVTSLLVSISAAETTEIKLKNLKDIYDNNLAFTDFETTGYMTIDPGGDNEEIISFTGFTINSDSSASIDTGIVRGLVATSPYGAGGTASAHAAGVRCVISNNPQMYDAIIDYVDGIAIAGVADASTTAKGIVEHATQAEVDAKTEAGSTGAKLNVSPNLIRSTQYNDYKADGGAADAYEITPAPAITAYAAGQEFTFKATNANTGASTIDVNGLGAKAIKKTKGVALIAGDIQAGQIIKVVYDGTNMEVVSETTKATPQIVTFPTSGTWTKDAGLTYVIVESQGGGGGGGGGAGGASGGGGGAYCKELILASALGATETVTVATLVGSEVDGIDTTFGSHHTAAGGTACADGARTVPGVGGTGTGGDVNISGGNGNSLNSTTDDVGGGGGGSVLGYGGASVYPNANGGSGTGYGGGGSGSSGTGTTGGNGSAGIVIVTEYYA